MVAPGQTAQRLPYPPGWMDRLFNRVERLPVPYAVFYALLALLAYALETLVKWSDGSYAVGTFNTFHLFFSANFALGMGLIHYLRNSARRAFEQFRPFLKDPATAGLEAYVLTTAPLAKSLLSGLLGVAVGLFLYANAPAAPASKLYTSPQATLVDMAFLLLFWATFGGAIHWLSHYLRATGGLYRKSRTDLLRPQPLYVFSGLNLRLAIGATLLNYAFLAQAPQQSLRLNDYLACGLVEVVVVACFVLPGWSVHTMLLAEKRRRHDEIHSRIERMVTQLYVEVDMGTYGQMDGINKALSALQTEHALLDKTSTWPWPIDSPRLLATAIFVPIMLWLTQRVLERMGI